MIRVDRARVPEPQALHAKSVEGHLREVSAFFEQRALETRRQERFRFPLMTKPVFEDVMGALRKVFSGKCAYCETPLSRDNESLDRFRPKKGAIGLTQDYAPDHYWWLAYEWRNLYAACATCNKNKGSKFPVKGQRVRLKASWRDLDREQRLLIDPCGDDPTLDLAFQEDGFVAPHSERGDVTMGVLELNRRDLVRARAELGRRVALAIVGLRHLTAGPEGIDVSGPEDLVLSVMKTGPAVSPYQAKTLDWLSEAARPSAPHAAVARTLIRSWLSSLAPATPTTRALRKVRKARHVRLKTQYITAIEIRGFRGVSQLDLAVPTQTSEDAPAPHLMLLGENGAGKSSILQAIALTVGGGKGSGIRPAEVLRQGAKAGRVRIHISGNAVPLELKLGRGTTSFTVAGEPFHGVLLAYGATRLLPRGSNGKAGTGKRRVTNLFDPFRPLLDANRWMSRLPRPTFDYVARALKDVLDLPRAARLRVVTTRSGPQVRVRLYGCDLGLEQLSDGYQSVLGLTCDVMSGLMSTQLGALEAAEGIVLIDELGAHLHPRWRMRVVSSLRKMTIFRTGRRQNGKLADL